ncbi:hypothetical protein FUAX_51190 (plasmid) [Fulvitalea axinellae]|uniref:Uncharacterized protein n=1 Tax=Fulvitalea axinellae TaxID=1182444 RepID=A0AAU9CY05_9BACT|nr:hypothetical protein FUAX_51190 [Fulvitalea axinellae]
MVKTDTFSIKVFLDHEKTYRHVGSTSKASAGVPVVQRARVMVNESSWRSGRYFSKDPFGRIIMIPSTAYPHLTIIIDTQRPLGKNRLLKIRSMHYSPAKDATRFNFIDPSGSGVFIAQYFQPGLDDVIRKTNGLLKQAGFDIYVGQGSLARSDNDPNWRRDLPAKETSVKPEKLVPEKDTSEDQPSTNDMALVPYAKEVPKELKKPDFEKIYRNFVLGITRMNKSEKREELLEKSQRDIGNLGAFISFVRKIETLSDVPDMSDFLEDLGHLDDLPEDELCLSMTNPLAWLIASELTRKKLTELEEDLIWLRNMVTLHYENLQVAVINVACPKPFVYPNDMFDKEFGRLVSEHDDFIATAKQNIDEIDEEDIGEKEKKEKIIGFIEWEMSVLKRIRSDMAELIIHKSETPIDKQKDESKAAHRQYPYNPPKRK